MEGDSRLPSGLILVICILFLPRGIEGLIKRRSETATAPQAPAIRPAASIPGAGS